MKDYADSWKKAPSRPANAEMDNFQGSEERREKQMPEGPTLVEELGNSLCPFTALHGHSLNPCGCGNPQFRCADAGEDFFTHICVPSNYILALNGCAYSIDFSAEAARGGADKLKPALQKIYYSRVQIFRDTAMGFVEGYKEGLREVTSPQATDQQPPGPPGTDHAPTHPQDSFTGNSPQEEVLDPVPTKLPSTTPPAQTPQPKPDQDEVKTT